MKRWKKEKKNGNDKLDRVARDLNTASPRQRRHGNGYKQRNKEAIDAGFLSHALHLPGSHYKTTKQISSQTNQIISKRNDKEIIQ